MIPLPSLPFLPVGFLLLYEAPLAQNRIATVGHSFPLFTAVSFLWVFYFWKVSCHVEGRWSGKVLHQQLPSLSALLASALSDDPKLIMRPAPLDSDHPCTAKIQYLNTGMLLLKSISRISVDFWEKEQSDSQTKCLINVTRIFQLICV